MSKTHAGIFESIPRPAMVDKHRIGDKDHYDVEDCRMLVVFLVVFYCSDAKMRRRESCDVW